MATRIDQYEFDAELARIRQMQADAEARHAEALKALTDARYAPWSLVMQGMAAATALIGAGAAIAAVILG